MNRLQKDSKITAIINSLNLNEQDGIFYSEVEEKISYPEDGHQTYFEIEDHSFWFKHRNNVISFLATYYCKNQLFLDLGGGNGYVSKGLQDQGFSVILMEPSSEAVINAKKRGIHHIICASSQDFMPLKGKIETIGAFDVLEHIENDTLLLDEIYQLLKPTGYFFITVPAFQFLWSKDDIIAGHFRRYNRKLLLEKLKRSGFEIRYSSYLFSILLVPLLFLKTLPYNISLPKKKNNPKKDHIPPNNWMARFLNIFWKWEIDRIKKKKTIPFGTSCIVIAQKP